jgi:hypothetical protein
MYSQATIKSLVVDVKIDVFDINIDAVTTKYRTKNTSVADIYPHHFHLLDPQQFSWNAEYRTSWTGKENVAPEARCKYQ